MTSRPHTPVHQDSGRPFEADCFRPSMLSVPPTASTDTSTTLVNPTSTILQGLIKEQRATRGSRKIVPQLSEDVDHTPTSQSHSQSHENSPSEKQRRNNSFASSGLKQPRDMGIREMDQVCTPDLPCNDQCLMTTSIVCVQNEQAKLRLEARDLSSHAADRYSGEENGAYACNGRGVRTNA